MPRARSNSTWPSRVMRPPCGLSSPAIASSTVLLPAPESPNRATQRDCATKPMSIRKSANSWCRSSSIMTSASPQRPAEESRDHGGGKGDGEGDHGQALHAAVAAGHAHQFVDGDGQGPRLAGNAGNKGDGRAKLAEGSCKGEHAAGDDAACRERNDNRHEASPG